MDQQRLDETLAVPCIGAHIDATLFHHRRGNETVQALDQQQATRIQIDLVRDRGITGQGLRAVHDGKGCGQGENGERADDQRRGLAEAEHKRFFRERAMASFSKHVARQGFPPT